MESIELNTILEPKKLILINLMIIIFINDKCNSSSDECVITSECQEGDPVLPEFSIHCLQGGLQFLILERLSF